MSPKDIAVLKLLANNYKVFIPISSPSDDLVIHTRDGLKLCLVRSTRDTKRGPNLLFGTAIDFAIYDYILAVERENSRCWVIPIVDIDINKKSMMLSGFANNYSLVPQNMVRKIVEKKHELEVAKQTEKIVKLNKTVTKVETNEDILNLLSKG